MTAIPLQTATYRWHRQTIAETFDRIGDGPLDPSVPWVAIGDFLDDWYRSAIGDRLELVETPISKSAYTKRSNEGEPLSEIEMALRRWVTFCAAMVEWLCWQDRLPFPAWTTHDQYQLADPWFLYPGDLLRAWQLATTPTPFKMRNIFTGDRVLNRA